MARAADLKAAIRKAEGQTNRNPSEAAKKSGNYRKGRFVWNRLTIAVENPKGSTRRGTGPDGKPWSVVMPATYGYIERTKGADGDELDIYMGPNPESRLIFVIDQVDADSRGFDEHKAMLGYVSLDAALRDYEAAFDDGRGSDRRGAVTPLDLENFRRWLFTRHTKRPIEHTLMRTATDSQREKTPEGMVRSKAVLTRAGPITYRRSELNMDGDGTYTVHRTIESLRHPDTIASLRGAPITLDHPPDGVTPDNYKDRVVGSVAGEPGFESNTIVGDVLIGDREALRRLDDGIDELSIGYDFVLGEGGATKGPIRVNHVAIVEKGRAGGSVRVLDSWPENDLESPQQSDTVADVDGNPSSGGAAAGPHSSSDPGRHPWEKDTMTNLTKADVQEIVDAAIDEGMKRWAKKGSGEESGDSMRDMMGDILAPVTDAMQQMSDAAVSLTDAEQARQKDEFERKRVQDAADAKKRATDAAEKLVADTRTEERARYAVMIDAQPLLPEADQKRIHQMEMRDILVAAVGDAVPDAENQSIEFLRGAVNMIKHQKSQGGVTGRRAAGDDLPPGVVAFNGGQSVSAQDARTSAMNEFIDAQAKAYSDGGGI